ncbi:hypothetical protein ACTFIU_003840 [Dictyostelium citrinum]
MKSFGTTTISLPSTSETKPITTSSDIKPAETTTTTKSNKQHLFGTNPLANTATKPSTTETKPSTTETKNTETKSTTTGLFDSTPSTTTCTETKPSTSLFGNNSGENDDSNPTSTTSKVILLAVCLIEDIFYSILTSISGLYRHLHHN